MTIIKYIVCLTAVAILTSCEKELDFVYHDIEPLPVIEASLSQAGADVSITYTTPMDEQMDNKRLTDALVSISDITSATNYTLEAEANGIFHADILPVEGHDYRLSVVIAGKEYTSECRMESGVYISDIKFCWLKMPGDDMAALQIHFTDNPLAVDYYWVRLYRNGKAYKWSLLSDHAAVDGMMEETITTTHRDTSDEDENQLLLDGDIVTVSVSRISRSMFDYLAALINGSNGAAQFSGDKCLGYFLASPVATESIVYSPDKIDYAL